MAQGHAQHKAAIADAPTPLLYICPGCGNSPAAAAPAAAAAACAEAAESAAAHVTNVFCGRPLPTCASPSKFPGITLGGVQSQLLNGQICYLLTYLHGLGISQAPCRQTARSQHGSWGLHLCQAPPTTVPALVHPMA
jgi:hypothetical protein